MDGFLKMDIFFFVTTMAVVLLSVFGAVVLWRLERVLYNIERISLKVAHEADAIHDDLVELRANVREKGRLLSFAHLFKKFLRRTSKKS